MKYPWLDTVSLCLIIIGAVNWGLIGLFNLDLVALLFGNYTMISRIIYSIIGIAGIYSLTFFFKDNTVK